MTNNKTNNELLMEEYEQERKEKAQELKDRKAREIKRRQFRNNRHAWAEMPTDNEQET